MGDGLKITLKMAEHSGTQWFPLFSAAKVCMETQDLNGFDSKTLALCPTEFQFPPKPGRHVFLAPRTPLGVQRDVLETRKPSGVSGAEVNHWVS